MCPARPIDQRAAKGGTQKGVGHFFLFRSPFGDRFVTFSDAFGHFFAYLLLPPPFCGMVNRSSSDFAVNFREDFLVDFLGFSRKDKERRSSNARSLAEFKSASRLS